MANQKHPYGQEINEFGSEDNALYISDVTGNRGSFKQKSVSESDNLSQINADNNLTSSLSVEAESMTSVAEVTSASTSATGIAATTATGVAGATAIAVTIGIVSIGASLAAIAHNFSYSSNMMDRSIYYSLEVEATKDMFVYTHLLDEENNEVEVHEFEIYKYESFDEPHIQDERNGYYPIYGEFHELHYHTQYTFEAFYYEEDETRKVFYEQKGLEVAFEPYNVGDVDISFDPTNMAAQVSFNYFYSENDKEVKISFVDDQTKQVTYEESFLTSIESASVDYGEGYYQSHYELISEGLEPEHTYILNISIDGNNLYNQSFVMPLIEQTIFFEEFSYESDMTSRSIYTYYYLRITANEYVTLNLYNEAGDLVASKERYITLEDSSPDGETYYYSLDEEFSNLDYQTNYSLELFYYVNNNKILINQQQELMIEIEANSITNVSYEFDARRKAMRYTFDMTFDSVRQEVSTDIIDVTGAEINSQPFYTVIDPENPGYVDYGGGIYGIRFTSEVITSLEGEHYYTIRFSMNQSEIYNSEFYFPISEEGYIPYVSLNGYSSNYEDKVVNLAYTYIDNGVTYSLFKMYITNLNTEQSAEYTFQDIGDVVVIPMESLGLSIGYTYRFNLFGVDADENETSLTQSAIYY